MREKSSFSSKVITDIFLTLVMLNTFQTKLFSQANDSTSFFPMHIGDRWVYRNMVDSSTFYYTIIGDTLDLDNVHWYTWRRNTGTPFFYRVTEDSEVIFKGGLTHEGELRYRLNASIGECWYVTGDSIQGGQIARVDTNQQSPTEMVIDYYYGYCDTVSAENLWTHTDILVSGLGLWDQVYEGGGAIHLIGAIVDGVIYGNPELGTEYEQRTTPLFNGFNIYSNYPNPFNTITSIRYVLPEESFIEISIYDLSGREIKTLVNGLFEAGYKKVDWAGRDSFGNQVPSGMYFYRLNAVSKETGKQFHQIRKMVLLR